MAEKYCTRVASVASGTNKTLINLYHSGATPTCRGRIYDLVVGSAATPADQAADFLLGRSTAKGTGTALTPNNLDPGGPAGEIGSDHSHSAEPTYTSSKQLLAFQLNQRATFRWVAAPGSELVMTASQNNGAGIQTVTSTSTQAYGCTMLFEE
jgi:hypothetical protein